MTETITHIAVKKLNNHALEKCFFQVLEGVQISMDERGCLAITAKQLSDELIVTNDLVALVSENEFEWLGRFDNIINSGGVKHIPEQIEKKLESILQQRFFIVGVNDKVLGEKIVLMIEGEKDQKIVNQIAELTILNRYEKPKEIFFIKNFTETATGKINRMKTMTQI
jgi:O-succinylbenzoic acid--CoA ligase